MKSVLLVVFLLFLPFIIGAEISIDNNLNKGEYINQTIVTDVNKSEITLYCASYNQSKSIIRQLILPDGSIININVESYTTRPSEINLPGTYEFYCETEEEGLVLNFKIIDDTNPNNSTNNDYIVIAVIILVTVVIIVIVIIVIYNI